MNINTKNLVSISEANQNFSKVARLVDESGSAVILKNNVPRYLVMEFSRVERELLAPDEDVASVSVGVPFGSPIANAPLAPGGSAVLPDIVPGASAELPFVPPDICPLAKEGFLAFRGDALKSFDSVIGGPPEGIRLNKIPICLQPSVRLAACFDSKAFRHGDDFVEIHRADPGLIGLDRLQHFTDFYGIALQ